jgi:light-harvesting complex I chlorophyll a/b binding protein 4
MKALSAKDLPGVTAPLDYFDPLGFCNGVDEGRIRFYREVELKHGRVAMLAALGFVVGENFHPLFGGNIDVPSYIAFQQTPLQEFWRYVMFAIGLLELVSVSSFEFPVAIEWSDGQRRVFPRLWQVRASHKLGDFGFDPMGLKPTTEAELKAMQSKELNNGRAAMIGIAGMVAQELASGAKLLG